jgi:selenoprotein W-related protein
VPKINPTHSFELEYCVPCNYRNEAVKFTDEVLARWGAVIKSFDIVPSGWGTFEVSLNGELIFSKWALGRFARDGELMQLIADRIGPPLDDYVFDHTPYNLDEKGFPIFEGGATRSWQVETPGPAPAR